MPDLRQRVFGEIHHERALDFATALGAMIADLGA